MNPFKRAYTLYILHRYGISHKVWQSACKQLPIIQSLSAVQKAHLHELSTLFLHQKRIYAVQGFSLDEEQRVLIAAQACLPILALGLNLFQGWTDIIVYPDVFRVSRDEMDAFGIVHHQDRILSGESWSRGPVILSWQDIQRDLLRGHLGHCVIVHEIAHKLDMLNGDANGMPPLHVNMPSEHWTQAFSTAYQQLTRQLQHHHTGHINAYAATNPAEFFAVCSEYFFSAPATLQQHYPSLYQQMTKYYLQDPLQRLLQAKNFDIG